MTESLRDRVARVLYERAVAERSELEAPVFDRAPDSPGGRKWIAYAQADALIAAGLVAECGELPSTAFEVMATGHGLPIVLHHGAHDNPLRVRSWTHDGDRFLVEYVEVTS